MKIIRTLQDIQKLKAEGCMYRQITAYLESYWLALAQRGDFPPKHCAPMIFLESSADAERLECVGVSKHYRDTYPEYVELIDLMNGTRLYNACVLLNNEDAINVFSIQGTLGMETELFLKAECD